LMQIMRNMLIDSDLSIVPEEEQNPIQAYIKH